MIRVLLLIKGLGRGGAEQLLVDTVRHLDRGRFEPEVAYLLPWKNALVGRLIDEGIPVSDLRGSRGAAWVGRVRSLVRRRSIDLVHVHSPYAAVGARLGLARRTPILYTEHNVWARYHPATRWGNLLTFPRNDHVFAVSDHVAQSIRYPRALRHLRMPSVEVLHHGVDAASLAGLAPDDGVRAELGLPEDAPVVGTVANLKAHKGHEFLFRAATIVRETFPEVRFVLVGQGPRERELRRMADAMGLDGTVVFAGYREDPIRVASTFDVFALPSLHEGLSIALIEAMAIGKPPVITAVGGGAEVVRDGVEGSVVPGGDAEALATTIASLLGDGDLRARLGAAARERARDFDIRRAVRRIEDVYLMLAER